MPDGTQKAAENGAFCSNDFETIRRFLSNERFIALRQRADQGVFLWSDVHEADIPSGFTKSEVWELLYLVRRQTCIQLPWDTITEKGYAGKAWFSNTRVLMETLADIEVRIGPGSRLEQQVVAHRGSRPLMSRVYEDAAAAFEMSGYPLPADRVQRAFGDELDNADEATPLLRNFVDLFNGLDKMASNRISPWAIEHLYEELTRGVEPIVPTRPTIGIKQYEQSIYADPDVTLKAIAEILENKPSEKAFHPLLRLQHARWFFLVNQPFPAWNQVVELLVSHLFLRRYGFPALTSIPMTALERDWLAGTIEGVRKPDELLSHLPQYKDDYTPFYLIILGMISTDIDALESLVEQLEKRDAELQASLEGTHLNTRQWSILGNALNNPDVPQKIEPHRQSYHVSYATARSDFLDLVKRGLMTRDEVGHAFVFLPTRKLLTVYAVKE